MNNSHVIPKILKAAFKMKNIFHSQTHTHTHLSFAEFISILLLRVVYEFWEFK